jgi:hypothetical protein
MQRLRRLLAILVNGSTEVPDFTGWSWAGSGILAVRHRVVRRPNLCDVRLDDESVASWVIVAQEPPAGRSAPIDAPVVVYLRRPSPHGFACPSVSAQATSA